MRNPRILTEWIKFTNRGSNWKPSRWNSICSRHFDKADFREYLSRKCLKKDAIPSIITKSNISYETYHLTTDSPDESRVLHLEHDDYAVPTGDEGKVQSEVVESCRLCGERADSLTCNPLRSLDETEIELMFRKCLPGVNVHNYTDHGRNICPDCVSQLRQYSDFIDKILCYQRELGFNENFDSFATNENSLNNGSGSQSFMKSSTPNSNAAIFIKQEPINVKQEKVESSNRRPLTAQVPTTSPSMCLNPFAESKKIKGLMQQETNLPKTEMTYCHSCDRIFGSNYEICSHECTNAEVTDREQGNNCEIMEVITLNNPVSFIDLAEDENVVGEPRKLKTESFSEFERKERLEFEHAYAKRPTNASCNLKQEIIDPNNDASENGYEFNESFNEHDDQGFNQNPYFDESHQTYYDCAKCNQSFVSQELVDEHSTIAHSLKPKICSICNAKFKSSFEYLIHKSKVHALRFFCKQCKQKFHTPSALRMHERICTSNSKDFYFSCRHCGKSIRNLVIMKKHLNKCVGKHFGSMDELSQESRTIPQINAMQKYTCDICNQTFSRLKLFVSILELKILMFHIWQGLNSKFSIYFLQKQHKESHQTAHFVPEKVEHSNEASEIGDIRTTNLNDMTSCDASMKQSFKFMVDDSKFIFLNESKVLPPTEPIDNLSATFNGKFACDTCGRPFSTFIELKQHKLEHDSERKFSCSLCPKTFKGISGLKQHISGYHYKIKPYSCPICHYAYALKGDMQRCRHSKLKNQSSFKFA